MRAVGVISTTATSSITSLFPTSRNISAGKSSPTLPTANGAAYLQFTGQSVSRLLMPILTR